MKKYENVFCLLTCKCKRIQCRNLNEYLCAYQTILKFDSHTAIAISKYCVNNSDESRLQMLYRCLRFYIHTRMRMCIWYGYVHSVHTQLLKLKFMISHLESHVENQCECISHKIEDLLPRWKQKLLVCANKSARWWSCDVNNYRNVCDPLWKNLFDSLTMIAIFHPFYNWTSRYENARSIDVRTILVQYLSLECVRLALHTGCYFLILTRIFTYDAAALFDCSFAKHWACLLCVCTRALSSCHWSFIFISDSLSATCWSRSRRHLHLPVFI